MAFKIFLYTYCFLQFHHNLCKYKFHCAYPDWWVFCFLGSLWICFFNLSNTQRVSLQVGPFIHFFLCSFTGSLLKQFKPSHFFIPLLNLSNIFHLLVSLGCINYLSSTFKHVYSELCLWVIPAFSISKSYIWFFFHICLFIFLVSFTCSFLCHYLFL